LSYLKSDASTQLISAELAVENIRQQINLLNDKNADDANKISDLEAKIQFLKDLDEDEELPDDKKKEKFNELYEKKDSSTEKK